MSVLLACPGQLNVHSPSEYQPRLREELCDSVFLASRRGTRV
jgi:hypothetical protein